VSGSENNHLRLVLFGPPGAGKGTQAQLLRDRLDLAHISSGDLFRHNLNNKTPLGLRAAEYMNQGQLVPDEVTIDIILDKVLSLNSVDGFILDGFPRNRNQAQVLEEALSSRSRGIDKVVHIDVSEEELVKRLGGRFICRECQAPHSIDLGPSDANEAPVQDRKCQQCDGELYQREDDRPEAVQRRIDVYQKETLPVLDFYREKGLLLDVSGLDAIDIVNKHVLDGLGIH
jgi:adenylate kinase